MAAYKDYMPKYGVRFVTGIINYLNKANDWEAKLFYDPIKMKVRSVRNVIVILKRFAGRLRTKD